MHNDIWPIGDGIAAKSCLYQFRCCRLQCILKKADPYDQKPTIRSSKTIGNIQNTIQLQQDKDTHRFTSAPGCDKQCGIFYSAYWRYNWKKKNMVRRNANHMHDSGNISNEPYNLLHSACAPSNTSIRTPPSLRSRQKYTCHTKTIHHWTA